MKMKKLLSASIFGIAGFAINPAVGLFAMIFSLIFGGGSSAMTFATGIFDPTGLTLNTENVTDTSQLIYKAKFRAGQHRIFSGIDLRSYFTP